VISGLELFKLMREKDHLIDLPNAQELPPLRSQIEVRDVTFNYNSGKFPAVQNLSFTLKVSDGENMT
jgi:ABC-type multidrug transport system fused ATPase/permease subunit